MFPFVQQPLHAIGITIEDSNAEKLDKLEKWIRVADQSPEELAPIFGPVLGIDTTDRFSPLDLPPQRQKEIMLEAYAQRLVKIADRRPMLIIVEDAHWIDPTSLELVNIHIDQARDLSVMVVVTYRPEFEASWVGQPHTTLIALNRLDRSQCVALATNVGAGKVLSGEIIEQIAERTDGVPLFIEELTKAIIESGASELGEKESDPRTPAIPATLQDALEARLDRLDDARELAQIGAVIGRSFDYGLLAEVSDGAEDALRGALDRLVRSELVSCRGAPPDATYSFKHALVQDAAYNSLLRGRRQQLHGRIADCLAQNDPEASGVPPELLAHHFTEAGREGPAIDHWLSAGRKSMQRSANREAIGHLTRGLEALSNLPESSERDRRELTLQSVLGSAMMFSLGWSSREATQCYAWARELCLRVGDDRELFPILWGFWMIHASRAELTEWRRTAAEMLEIARRHDDDAMLMQAHHACWGNPFQGDFLSQIEHADQGLKVYGRAEHSPMAPQYGGHDAGVCGHGHGGVALWATGYPEQAAEAFSAARSLADQIEHLATLAHGCSFSGWEQVFRNDWQGAIRFVDEGIEKFKKSGSPQGLGRLHVLSGWARVALGDTTEGLLALRRGTEIERSHLGFGSGTVLAFHGEALHLAGLTAEALSALDEAVPLMKERSECLWEANAHALRGELLLAQSGTGHGEAEACFRTAIDIARDQSARIWELRAATRLARLWHGQGRTAEARDLLAPVYGWFTEGFDTADLKNAKALLEALS